MTGTRLDSNTAAHLKFFLPSIAMSLSILKHCHARGMASLSSLHPAKYDV